MAANRKHIRQQERDYMWQLTHNCGCIDVVRSRDVGKVVEHDPSVVIRHNFWVAILLYILYLRKQAKMYELPQTATMRYQKATVYAIAAECDLLTATKQWHSCFIFVFYILNSVHYTSNSISVTLTNNILIYIQQDATLHGLFCLKTSLHVSSGTVTHRQEHIQLYLKHVVFVTPLLLSAAISWNRFKCAVGGVRHPQHTQTSSNSSTIAADSSNGVTNTTCCRYSCMRS
jgi:hypothetical protein